MKTFAFDKLERGAMGFSISETEVPPAINAERKRKRLRLDSPAAVIGVGIGLMTAYAVLAFNLLPLPFIVSDSEHFRHWVDSNYKYSSSPFDFGVMSPYQGLGGLDQPLGVWINPSFIIPHLMRYGDPRIWRYLVNFVLLSFATLMLARAMDVPPVVAVVGTQVFVFLFCLPGCAWASWITHFNGADFVAGLPHLITPVALATLTAVVFRYVGRTSRRLNLLLAFIFPLVIVYAVLCDPLYMANSLVFLCFLLGGLYLGSTSRSELLWRSAAVFWSAIFFLAIRLPAFYAALAGYCARARFPNELYVEVQRWDIMTALIFQGGLATPCCLLVIICCAFMIVRGPARHRGFAIAVLGFQIFLAILSFVYVYSGKRWNWPSPIYLETTAAPAYLVALLLGVPIAIRSFLGIRGGLHWPVRRLSPGANLASTYRAISAVPAVGVIVVLLSHHSKMPYESSSGVLPQLRMDFDAELKDTRQYPLREAAMYLREHLAIDASGRFRGSVATLIGVPGGGLMAEMHGPADAPFTKANIDAIEQYFRYYDPHASMCGLWDLGVPTLEDNNHLVTPPFCFLFSRALSRPQDYHSRNWINITRIRSGLMAALGARFLLTDAPQQDRRLTLRLAQKNPDGLILYVYEISDANVGDLSPVQTVQSEDARETIGALISDDFSFQDKAVVDGPPISGLTHASRGEMFYERGGVRVLGETTGKSLVILPLQFSNSLKIVSIEENSSGCPIQILRVNLVETGLLFQGRINLKISHVFGLFRALDGRLHDIDDCRRLGIVEDGTIPYPPNYQPLAHREAGVLKDLFFPEAKQ